MGLSGALYHSNTLYLQEHFDAEETLRFLASGKITMFTHASLTYSKLLELEGEYDLSKARIFISGASPLPPAVWSKFKERFSHEIVECYGSSETGRIAANTLLERLPGSPGRVLPTVKVKLSDTGEVLVKSPGVFPGYFRNPLATKRGLAAGGWWRTGDLGKFENGRLVLRGRRQELIRRYGYSISPRDVEWAMHQYQPIKEVYVMGTREPGDSNDKLVYFLVTTASQAQIQRFYKANLPSIWRPYKVLFVKSIPRTRTGKPQIAKLRAMLK